MTAMPAWTKIIMAVAIVTWIGAVYGTTSLLVYSFDTAKQATNPAYITKTMNAICKLELGKNFQAQLAIGLPPLQMVSLAYKPDGTTFMIGCMPPSERTERSTREIANDLADHGNPYLFDNFKIEKESSRKVAGETLEYSLGAAEDKEGQIVGAFVGCIVPQGKKTVIVVYGLSPTQKFNMDAATELLDSVKGF